MSATNANAGAPERSYALGGPMAWWVWTLAVVFVVYLFSFQTGYSIVNPNVQKDVGLTIGQVGTIAAVYTWAFAIAQFFGGALLDRLGARKVLPISIALVTVGIFLFATAKSYPMLLVSQVVLAVGSCTGFVGAGYIGGQWFGFHKFSFMFGLVQVVAAATSAFSVNLIFMALAQTTWRSLFTWVAVFGVLLFVLGLIYIKNPAPVPAPPAGSGGFFSGVLRSMADVAKIPHVWIASLGGAFSFGALLALGVVWMPKLLQVHGIPENSADTGASLLWLGLAVGSAIIPWWSDRIRKRKLPIILGTAVVQLAALLPLVYVENISSGMGMVLCFVIGFANASHMLAFSTAADVAQPSQIGTSAAVVNGIMFILGGVLISRPGVRIGWGIDAGLQPASWEIAKYASLPIVVACAAAIVLGLVMRETYPPRQ